MSRPRAVCGVCARPVGVSRAARCVSLTSPHADCSVRAFLEPDTLADATFMHATCHGQAHAGAAALQRAVGQERASEAAALIHDFQRIKAVADEQRARAIADRAKICHGADHAPQEPTADASGRRRRAAARRARH